MKKIALQLLMISSVIFAEDTLHVSTDCAKPIKPLSFSSNYEVNKYNASADQYRVCVYAFIDKHRELAKKENDIANSGIKEWNDFVQKSNNQKKEKDNGWSSSPAATTNHTVNHSDGNMIFKNFKF